MTPNKPASELRQAINALRPYFVRAAWFSLFSSLLVLSPSDADRAAGCRAHGGSPVWRDYIIVGPAYQGCADTPRRSP